MMKMRWNEKWDQLDKNMMKIKPCPQLTNLTSSQSTISSFPLISDWWWWDVEMVVDDEMVDLLVEEDGNLWERGRLGKGKRDKTDFEWWPYFIIGYIMMK